MVVAVVEVVAAVVVELVIVAVVVVVVVPPLNTQHTHLLHIHSEIVTYYIHLKSISFM